MAEEGKLDGVLVSDVGKRIAVQSGSAGGVIRTALRATDILMDRVWQLETETFHDTAGFVFAPITDVVEPAEDATALHPELQRQAANIRTDLDRFSPLEISSLIKHGYCVGRKVCRANPDLFGADLPGDAPWDPNAAPPRAAQSPAPVTAITSLLHHVQAEINTSANGAPAQVTVDARTLQASGIRRIWSTLLDYRDWASYVYVPILVPLMVLLPYFVISTYQYSRSVSRLIQSISQGSMDFEIMSHLLEGPMRPFPGEVPEQVSKLEEPNFKGFEILQDSRIFDLRPWNAATPGKGEVKSMVYGYRRLKILKLPDNSGNDVFRIGLLVGSADSQIRFPVQPLRPKLRMMDVESAIPGEKMCRFEASVDFQRTPAGETVDLIYEHYSPGLFLKRGDTSTSISFVTEGDTAEVTRWFLMPRGKDYRSFRITRYPTANPGAVEVVKGFTEYLADDSTILAYKMVSTKAGYTYEVTWFYK
jgi:hypothetical protein